MGQALTKLFMIIAMPFVTFILHVLTCGVFAWFIGLFFGNGILGMLSAMGIEGFSMWQIGIFMGFFSGFFRRIITFNGKGKSKDNVENNDVHNGNVIINVGNSKK